MIGLDLFSGIGGLTKALADYVHPIAYCENDRYAQAVLLSRMRTGDIPCAPIWDDITTLQGSMCPPVDIIYGGFPCQDISVAGRGAGLDGKRSGLFFEIIRLVGELRPRFVFLENVSAITVRGSERVTGELCKLGYDCRWGILSAQDVGANHRRERWWLLAHTNSEYGQRRRQSRKSDGKAGTTRNKSEGCGNEVAHSKSREPRLTPQWEGGKDSIRRSEKISDTVRERLERQRKKPFGTGKKLRDVGDNGWWTIEPNMGRVANGVPFRVDRLRGLGNSVVPAQAREAFERLMGLKGG